MRYQGDRIEKIGIQVRAWAGKRDSSRNGPGEVEEYVSRWC